MAGIHNDTLFGTNMDFSGQHPPQPQYNQGGQIPIGSAVSPYIRPGFLTSMDGSIKVNNSNGAIDLSSSAQGFQPNAVVQLFDDFLSNAQVGGGPLIGQLIWNGVSNSPPITYLNGTVNHPGLTVWRTDQPLCGVVLSDLIHGNIILGGGVLSNNFNFNLVTLSAVGNRYTTIIGLTDDQTGAPIVNGCYFSYSDNVNGGNWVLNCTSGSVTTSFNTSVAATTGFHTYTVFVNATGTSVSFYIDNGLVGTAITTNIPTTSINPYIVTIKSSGTFPSSQLDLFWLTLNLTTPRPGPTSGQIFNGFNLLAPTVAATTGSNLNATYNNGAGTLTNAGAMTAFTIDGVTPTINQRVLIKDQTSAFQNGIYTITTLGTGAVNWVLTRSTDYNLATEIHRGDLVPVSGGTVNANTLWIQTAVVNTLGTDAIVFQLFSTNPIFTTQHAVLIGGASNTIGDVGPGLAGQVLQGGGASADPVFSTATYPSVATSTGSLLRADGTNWSVTTSTYPNTNAVSTLLYASAANVMSALATANSGVLTTNSSGVPAITALGNSQFIATNASGTVAARAFSVNTQVFTTTGTYTPTTGMLYCIIECLGAGGGGGGAAGAATTNSSGAGGGSGGYCKALYTAAQIGASKSVTIGAAGTAGSSGNNAGGTGGTTTVGATLLSSLGGTGGAGADSGGVAPAPAPGTGGTSSVTSGKSIVALTGNSGLQGEITGVVIFSSSGKGADSPYGAGGTTVITGGTNGNAGTGFGSGGSGGYATDSSQSGGAGTAGIVIVTEYIIN